jgi:hypothetical protein
MGVLELVAEADGDSSGELSLAKETAIELTIRVQLLKAAWGGVAEAMDLAMLEKTRQGVIGAHRLTLDLAGLPRQAVFPAPMARMILNVMLVAAESMPRGGVLSLSGDATSHVVAQIAGADAAWPQGFALCIADKAVAWSTLGDPRYMQAPLTALIADSLGMRISLIMAATASTAGSPPPLLIAAAAG